MENEKQRERLVELLKETFEYTRGTCIDFDEAAEINADYLIANGVVVFPHKIGDKIYRNICGEKDTQEYEMILGLRKVNGVNKCEFYNKYLENIEDVFDIEKMTVDI